MSGAEDVVMHELVDANTDLERVFLRLVNAADSRALQVFVDSWLCKIVQLLGLHANNHTKKTTLMEMLNHLIKRLRADESIQIPVADLLALVRSSTDLVVLNISMVYIKMGFSRLTVEQRTATLPDLLHNAHLWPIQLRSSLLQTVCASLVSLAKVERKNWPDLSLIMSGEVKELFYWFFIDITVVPFNSTPDQQLIPPGLSPSGFKRVSVLTDIDTLKLNCVKFVCKSRGTLFTDNDAIVLLMLALADTSHEVKNAADVEMKKLAVSELIEENEVVQHVYELYIGQSNNKQLAESDRRNAVSTRHKLLLLQYLCRSRRAAAIFPKNIQVCTDALLGQHTNVRLQSYAIELVPAVLDACPPAYATTFIPILFTALRKFLADVDDTKLLVRGYMALSKAGIKHPVLITKDVSFIQRMFEDVSSGSDEESSSVADCLTSWIDILCGCEQKAVTDILHDFAVHYLTDARSRCRLVSLKFGERSFSPHDPRTMWLLCRTVLDKDDAVNNEAKRILSAFSQSFDRQSSFEQLIAYFHNQGLGNNKSNEQNEAKSNDKAKQALTAAVYQVAIPYTRHVLLVHNGCRPTADQSIWPEHVFDIDGLMAQVDEDSLGASLDSSTVNESAILQYVQCVLICVRANQGLRALELLHECVVHWPDVTLAAVAPSFTWIQDLCTNSSQRIMCSLAAKVYARLWHRANHQHITLAMLTSVLDEFNKLPTFHGHWLSSWIMAFSPSGIAPSDLLSYELKLYENVNVNETNMKQLEASCGSLAQYYRYRTSGLQSDELIEKIKDTLAAVAQSQKAAISTPCHIAAIQALAVLQPIQCSPTFHQFIIEQLVKIAEGPPRLELQPYVGTALFSAAVGQLSSIRRDLHQHKYDDWLSEHAATDETKEKVNALIELIVTQHVSSTNRHIKRSAIIWLYSIVKCCVGQMHLLDKHSKDMQKSFLAGLAEPNDLVQEMCSTSLGVLYECGDADQQKEMMDILVESLAGNTTTTKPAGGTEDMEVSHINVSTATGEAPATYKEMYNLAAEMNKPELVYKFMQLANNQAMWNTKVGAAFGVGKVLSQAKEQLKPHLRTLIPKLYRYRFDPDAKVALSMKQIWQLAVGQDKDVIEQHCEQIFQEISDGMTNPQWRIRESCCYALCDLLTSNYSSKVADQLPELWSVVFRVQDDMKESVRTAANRAANSLCNTTVRMCQSKKEDDTRRFGEILLILIEQGLVNKVSAVKQVTLKCIIDLCRHAGASLRPHLLVIMPSLLDAMSDLEPAVLNYLAARSQGDTAEQLDSARAAAARSSPLMDALQDCVRLLDEESLKQLAPQLAKLLRNSIGLPTRSAVCSLLTAICASYSRELNANPIVAGQLIQALTYGLSDRNVFIRKQYAATIGRLARYASNAFLHKTVDKIIKAYLNQADEATETALMYGLHGIAHNSPETLVDMGSTVAPIVLMQYLHYKDVPKEQRDALERQTKMWSYVWNELISTTESGVRLYENEIMDSCCTLLLDCNIWRLRADASLALGAVAVHCTPLMPTDKLSKLASALFTALDGPIWEGKLNVLTAIANTFTNADFSSGKHSISAELLENWRTRLVRECRKKKVPYKTGAIECATAFAVATDSIDTAKQIVEIVRPLLEKPASMYDSDDEEDDAKVSVQRAAEMSAFEQTACRCLNQLTAIKLVDVDLMGELLVVYGWVLQRSDWRSLLCVVECTSALIRVNHQRYTSGQKQHDVSGLIEALLVLFERSTQQSLQSAISKCLISLMYHCNSDPSSLTVPSLTTDNKNRLRELLTSRSDQLSMIEHYNSVVQYLISQ